jgi:glutamate racemase
MQGIKKNNQPIGVFDSGVGGLSILIELKNTFPKENFVFFADQKHVPYGEKSKKELIKLTSNITDYLLRRHNIKILVVACNTATCGAIHELRAKFPIPIVGTVPAVKVAASKTKSGTIAVISTPSTSKSETLRKLIRDYCNDLKVFNIGCKNLENTVEKGELQNDEINELLLKYLHKVKNSKTDQLVLGCTHYPFLKKSIQKTIGSSVKLIDSGKAIAKHTKMLVLENHMKNSQKKYGKTLYFTTGDDKKFSNVASKLLNEKVKAQTIRV